MAWTQQSTLFHVRLGFRVGFAGAQNVFLVEVWWPFFKGSPHSPRRCTVVEYFVAMRMAATRIGFSRPAGFDLGLRNSGHLRLLRESISCFVSCGFRLQCGGCTSRAQDLKLRAQNFDLHCRDPQHSGTPNVGALELLRSILWERLS